MQKYIKRLLENDIKNIAKSFPVILVCGPRQVGKTTILKNYVEINQKKINYVTLDDPMTRKLAKEDPSIFLEKYKTPLIIDEIQYATELLPYIKMIVDNKRFDALKNNKNSNGLYFLTTSQMFSMMKNVSESLAGRVGIMDMYGLSYSEIVKEKQEYFLPTYERCKEREDIKRQEIMDVYETIIRGSFPALYQDETKFLTFMSAVAARTGQELNYNNISKDVGIDNKTAEKWLSILRTSGLVYLLQPYSNNPTTRAIKTPKLHFTDTGLACYLAGYSDANTLEKSAINGNIFETYIVMEMVKSFVNDNKDSRLYLFYYRDSNQKEIDLIITMNNTLYPVEIKKTKNPNKDMIKNFSVLEKGNIKIGDGGIICMVDKILPIDKNNNAIPIQCI